jgi:hypothetical protein
VIIPVPIEESDAQAVAVQLGRPPRGLRAVAHRCPCGLPDVVETAPRLPDGTPFPTLYYLTCPRAVGAISGLEADGMMRDMTARLAADSQAREAYRDAHRDYLARRDAAAADAGIEPLPPGTQTAGGMPDASSACTPWPPTNWPCRVRTRSAAPPWTPLARGGAAARASRPRRRSRSRRQRNFRHPRKGPHDIAPCRRRGLRHELHPPADRRHRH